MLKLSFHFQVVEFLKLIIKAVGSLFFARAAQVPAPTQVSSAGSAGTFTM